MEYGEADRNHLESRRAYFRTKGAEDLFRLRTLQFLRSMPAEAIEELSDSVGSFNRRYGARVPSSVSLVADRPLPDGFCGCLVSTVAHILGVYDEESVIANRIGYLATPSSTWLAEMLWQHSNEPDRDAHDQNVFSATVYNDSGFLSTTEAFTDLLNDI